MHNSVASALLLVTLSWPRVEAVPVAKPDQVLMTLTINTDMSVVSEVEVVEDVAGDDADAEDEDEEKWDEMYSEDNQSREDIMR